MKVVKLDTSRVGKLREKMPVYWGVKPELVGLNEKEFRYLLFQVRERRWVNILRKQAKGGDIVMAHQNHIIRIQPKLLRFGMGQNILLVSKPMKNKFQYYPPLSHKEVKLLKNARAAKRPINLGLKK